MTNRAGPGYTCRIFTLVPDLLYLWVIFQSDIRMTAGAADLAMDRFGKFIALYIEGQDFLINQLLVESLI